MKRTILFIFSCFVLAGFLLLPVRAANLAQDVAGRILIQVQAHGEAWYVSPDGLTRYYLGRPADALNVMRAQGVGITNANLEKIPVGLTNLAGTDSDGDGLPDALEAALGTNINNPDSDGDGNSDLTEIANGYDPLGPGKLPIDPAFARTQRGRILLQVQAHGEAWYVNPADDHRYFLGRPADAFALMRSLGLGISDADLAQIAALTPNYDLTAFEQEVQTLVNGERSRHGLKPLIWNSDIAAVAREHSRDLAQENEAFTGMDSSCSFPLIHHEGLDFGLYQNNRLNARGIYYFGDSGENIALMSGATYDVTCPSNDPAVALLKNCEQLRNTYESDFTAAMETASGSAAKLALVKNEIAKRTAAFAGERKVTITSVDWLSQAQLASNTVTGWMNSPGHRANILNADYTETGIGAAYVNGYVITTQDFIARVSCGFQGGPCCEKTGYYPYCYEPLKCEQNICGQ